MPAKIIQKGTINPDAIGNRGMTEARIHFEKQNITTRAFISVIGFIHILIQLKGVWAKGDGRWYFRRIFVYIACSKDKKDKDH